MPKKAAQEPDLSGSVPDIPLYRAENNPELEIPPEALQSILEYFDVGEFEAISLECDKKEKKLQVVIRTPSNHASAQYIGIPDDTKIISSGYFVLEIKKTLSVITNKYKNANMLKLTWPPGKQVNIIADNKSPVNITPKSISTIAASIPPMNRRFTFKDRVLHFNKKENKATVFEKDGITPVTEPCKTSLVMDTKEILKGNADVSVAGGVDYIIYEFSEQECGCVSGTWNTKGDDSRTDDLEFSDFEGEEVEMAMPKLILNVAKRMPGKVHINATKEKKVLSLSYYPNAHEDIHYCFMESKKKV